MDIHKKLYQFHSDIHFEFYNCDKIKSKVSRFIVPTSHYCILAGDIFSICEIKKVEIILKYCADNFKKTFLITGNHEYYCFGENKKTITSLTSDLNKLISEINSNNSKNGKGLIQHLENGCGEMVGINGDITRVYGSTLWSKVPTREENKDGYQTIKDTINDYNNIYTERTCNFNKNSVYIENINPGDIRDLYEKNIKNIKTFLDNEVKENEKIIIVTHHAPLNKGTSDEKYENEKNRFVNSAYANDLDDFIRKNNDKISMWIFGHTHYNCDFTHRNVRVVSNQCGYKSQHGSIKYKSGGVEI